MKKVKIFIILIFLIAICFISYNRFIIKIIYPKEYSEYVEKYAAMYNVDPLLVYSIIKAESNFDKNAVSNMRSKRINANHEFNSR